MEKDYKNITLEELKSDISFREDDKLGFYFDNELSMSSYHDENGYLIIIEFFNHLKNEYNKCINENREQAKSYHGVLLRAFGWFLPFLNPYHQIIAQSNLCILTDDEQDDEFYKKIFRDNLKRANNLIEITKDQILATKEEYEKEALCQALDSISYLNIREHNYRQATLCLSTSIDLLLSLDIDNPARHELFDLYIRSIVRLANCYEYRDNPWAAIKCILNMENLVSTKTTDLQAKWKDLINANAGQIRDQIINYYNSTDSKHNSKDATINTVKTVCRHLFVNPTENRHFNVFNLNKAHEPISDALKSYIHVLAHCISEYVAKIRGTNYSHPFCSTLQMVSRFLLDWLVVSCHEKALVTCQATVRAENDACPEALKLLLKRHVALEAKGENCTMEEQSELQEIEFFLFYFSEQELRYNYTDKDLEEIFKCYGGIFFESASDKAKHGDCDSLFHYYVIEFKYLFKQKVDKFIHTYDNNELDTQQLDNVFLEMCKCKKQCSDQIFKGLIDECERLEKLFALFQQLQWLNNKNVSQTKVNLFKQQWELYKKSGETFNIREIVLTIHKEIIKRNKILILAPIKNAPSCSSEYDNIQNLLELPTEPLDFSSIDGSEFVKAFKKIERARQQTAQYDLSASKEYSNLKWAIYYPNEGAFIYLYMKNEGATIKYREVVPLYLDTERNAIAEILKRIDDAFSDEFDFSISEKLGSCPGECPYCNTFLLEPGDECNLKKLINELLVFIEFDFHAACQIGHLDKEHILINYPQKDASMPHDFWVLAFEEHLPEKESENGFCDICRNSFVKLSLAQPIKKEDRVITEPLSISCEIFSIDTLKQKRTKVYKEIDGFPQYSSSQKEQIKSGELISNCTAQIRGFTDLCNHLNSCLDGNCDKARGQECETCKLLKEYNFA